MIWILLIIFVVLILLFLLLFTNNKIIKKLRGKPFNFNKKKFKKVLFGMNFTDGLLYKIILLLTP